MYNILGLNVFFLHFLIILKRNDINMKLGIVGLPNVGKSTLFNAITKAGAESANYPFCTIDPNVGIVTVPDERLDVLTKMYNSKKTVPATIEFVDIAGLVKGASKGEGLGNKFLSHIREVDAIIHVVRCFEDPNIVHVEGSIDPKRDIDTINIELMLADLDIIEKRIDRTRKMLKGDKKYQAELDTLLKIKEGLENETCIRLLGLSEEEKESIKEVALITEKPVIYATNVSEDDFISGIENNEFVKMVEEIASKEDSLVLPISAKIESEIAELDEEEKKDFLSELGINESGLDRLIKASYKLLGLMSYLTAGEPETRAWTIKIGTKAPQAAGKIHSDFERGFIRAEVISYDDLIKCGSMTAAKEKGLVRSEGKEYVFQDGDIVLFRFNV